MAFSESKEYMGGFEGSQREGEMIYLYNNFKKQKINIF